MKINSAEFEVSAPDLRSCPEWAQPEIALIGRSNVGKSSLINLLTGRRDLAKVSDLPGKTKLINFFHINKAWRLVDLPGYGYAHVGKQRRAEFNEAVADFLGQRRALRSVFVLIDVRLPPQPIDLAFLQWLESCQASYQLIFTKTDKLSPTQVEASIQTFLAATAAWRSEPPKYLTSSAKNGRGRTEILSCIGKLVTGPWHIPAKPSKP
ncbi:ribosome biogenesis GTP-binding protein YihA/YsxC [Opitutaceae bacterium]